MTSDSSLISAPPTPTYDTRLKAGQKTIKNNGNSRSRHKSNLENGIVESRKSDRCSTTEYPDKPSDVNKDNVIQLLENLFPGHSTVDFKIEGMQDNGVNRIVGVKKYPVTPTNAFHKLLRKACKEKDAESFILQIPQLGHIGIEHHVTTLQYAHRCVSIPVPSVLVHNPGNNNPLGLGYILQHRLPGKSLDVLWDTLSLEQKLSSVRGVTKAIMEFNRHTNHSAGRLSPSNLIIDLKSGPVKLDSFAVPGCSSQQPEFKEPKTSPSQPQTTKELLISLAERWIKIDNATHTIFPAGNIWNDFIQMTTSLYKLGSLPDYEPFYLCHEDLRLCDILVKSSTCKDRIEITGMVNWGAAVFAPKFMSCRAPFFWNDDESFEVGNGDAFTSPSDAEIKLFKETFEHIAGPEICKYAFGKEYILARRMFRVLRSGINSNQELVAAKAIISDFETIFPPSSKSRVYE